MPPKSQNPPPLPSKVSPNQSSSSHVSAQASLVGKPGSNPNVLNGRTNAGVGRRGRGKTQKQERDVIALMNDQNWVDRLAKELKTQREWSEKWGSLVDPQLYSQDEAKKTPWVKHQSATAISTGPFSILTPPANASALSLPQTPPDYAPATFKVTGDRTRYLKPSPSFSARPSPHPAQPAHHTAPFATDTPVSCLPKHHRGALPLRKHRAMPDPINVYKYPPTSNTEYGWKWAGMRSLEVYGSTHANFLKEAWKRLEAGGVGLR